MDQNTAVIDDLAPGQASPDLGYAVTVEAFSGPLDLLLYLVRRAEVDIAEIPIAEIATQFALTVASWTEMDLELAGEFVLMAATLLELKARLVAPPLADPDAADAEAEEEDVVDLHGDLIRKLLIFRKYKEITLTLTAMEEQQALRHWRRMKEDIPDDPDEAAGLDLDNADPYVLASTWELIDKRINGLGPRTVMVDSAPLEVTIQQLITRLERDLRCTLRAVLADESSLTAKVTTVMALLESSRTRHIESKQLEQWGDVDLRWRPEPERVIVALDFPPDPDEGRKRKRRPPLATWHAQPGSETSEADADHDAADEAPIENDEQRFTRELEEACQVEAILGLTADVEASFAKHLRFLRGEPEPPPPPPPEPEPPKAVKPPKISLDSDGKPKLKRLWCTRRDLWLGAASSMPTVRFAVLLASTAEGQVPPIIALIEHLGGETAINDPVQPPTTGMHAPTSDGTGAVATVEASPIVTGETVATPDLTLATPPVELAVPAEHEPVAIVAPALPAEPSTATPEPTNLVASTTLNADALGPSIVAEVQSPVAPSVEPLPVDAPIASADLAVPEATPATPGEAPAAATPAEPDTVQAEIPVTLAVASTEPNREDVGSAPEFVRPDATEMTPEVIVSSGQLVLPSDDQIAAMHGSPGNTSFQPAGETRQPTLLPPADPLEPETPSAEPELATQSHAARASSLPAELLVDADPAEPPPDQSDEQEYLADLERLDQEPSRAPVATPVAAAVEEPTGVTRILPALDAPMPVEQIAAHDDDDEPAASQPTVQATAPTDDGLIEPPAESTDDQDDLSDLERLDHQPTSAAVATTLPTTIEEPTGVTRVLPALAAPRTDEPTGVTRVLPVITGPPLVVTTQPATTPAVAPRAVVTAPPAAAPARRNRWLVPTLAALLVGGTWIATRPEPSLQTIIPPTTGSQAPSHDEAGTTTPDIPHAEAPALALDRFLAGLAADAQSGRLTTLYPGLISLPSVSPTVDSLPEQQPDVMPPEAVVTPEPATVEQADPVSAPIPVPDTVGPAATAPTPTLAPYYDRRDIDAVRRSELLDISAWQDHVRPAPLLPETGLPPGAPEDASPAAWLVLWSWR